MKKAFLKIFLFGVVSLGGFLFVGASDAEACAVNSAVFRTVNQVLPNSWYTDTNPPYVYIDIQSTNCIGSTFQLSITESDNATGNLATVGAAFDDDLVNFDNKVINVSTNSFSIVTISGDEECDSLSSPYHCKYYIRINDNVLNGVTNFSNTSNLQYNCHNGCDNKNWEFVGFISYGSTHPDDPALNQDGGGQTEASTGGMNIEINLQNPLGGQNMTIVDFITKIIKFAITIGIPIVAIGIIYSGLLFVTARGNEEQLKKAKNAFTYAVIGGAVLLGSFIFAELIKDTIETIAMIKKYIA